jgi:hypothetical protein
MSISSLANSCGNLIPTARNFNTVNIGVFTYNTYEDRSEDMDDDKVSGIRDNE